MASSRASSVESQPDVEAIAVGLIVATDGRLLLQHRDAKPDLPGAGLWGFFGGHMQPGESPSAAFVRELREELGWQPHHFEHYATREVAPLPGAAAGSKRIVSHVFAAHLNAPLDALTLGEGQAMTLIAADSLPDALVPELRPFIEEFVRTDAYKRVKHEWARVSTAALIVDERGAVLLQLRDDKPKITNPGLWGTFGGRLELDLDAEPETPDQCLLRELREELGWTPAHYTLYQGAPYRPPGDTDPRGELIYIYAAALDVPPSTLVLGEGQAMRFFPPDALPAPIVTPLPALIERFAASDVHAEMIVKAKQALAPRPGGGGR